MSPEEITKVLAEARPQIAKFWASCLEAGLDGHTPDLTGKVDRALEAYAAALGALKGNPGKGPILAAMGKLFARLDEVNEEAEGSLLETDERELLVPVIIDAARAAGLDLSEFPDGDPTGEFRNF